MSNVAAQHLPPRAGSTWSPLFTSTRASQSTVAFLRRGGPLRCAQPSYLFTYPCLPFFLPPLQASPTARARADTLELPATRSLQRQLSGQLASGIRTLESADDLNASSLVGAFPPALFCLIVQYADPPVVALCAGCGLRDTAGSYGKLPADPSALQMCCVSSLALT